MLRGTIASRYGRRASLMLTEARPDALARPRLNRLAPNLPRVPSSRRLQNCFRAMNDSNRPTAQGSLAKTPFAHLVLYLYQKRSSGTLIVRTRDPLETKVLFHRGRAVAADMPQPSAALDQGLLPLCAAADGKFEFFESDLVGSGPSIVTGMFDPLAFVAESARRFVRPDVVQDVVNKYAGTELALQPAMDLTRLSLTAAETQFAEP